MVDALSVATRGMLAEPISMALEGLLLESAVVTTGSGYGDVTISDVRIGSVVIDDE